MPTRIAVRAAALAMPGSSTRRSKACGALSELDPSATRVERSSGIVLRSARPEDIDNVCEPRACASPGLPE